jgi:hypothetical protein
MRGKRGAKVFVEQLTTNHDKNVQRERTETFGVTNFGDVCPQYGKSSRDLWFYDERSFARGVLCGIRADSSLLCAGAYEIE